jgi:hypothetical protein
MKEELPMFGIEANDLVRQDIDREVRREPENILVVELRNAAAAIRGHAVGARSFFPLTAGMDHHREAMFANRDRELSMAPQIRQLGRVKQDPAL